MEGGTAISRRRAPCLPAVCGCAWVIKKQKTKPKKQKKPNQKNKDLNQTGQKTKPNRPKNQKVNVIFSVTGQTSNMKFASTGLNSNFDVWHCAQT